MATGENYVAGPAGWLLPRPVFVLLAPLALVLGACTGGGGGGGGGGMAQCFEATATTTITAIARDVTFNPTLANQYLADDEFNYADADFVDCPNSQSNPYALVNLHLARSAGLSGAGQLVAIVDEGFRINHPEFTGKTIDVFGVTPSATHGTHVASLIAAIEDGNGMFGVAPNASLHLASFAPDGNTFDLDNVVAATLDAANKGAIAQNNSWGFDVAATALGTYLQANPGQVAAGLSNLIGYSQADWQDYLDALDTFQNTGVIVFAISNEAPTDVLAALPAYQPSLSEAWVAVINGYFEVNGSGAITTAALLSASCGAAARFCIAADGTTFGAERGDYAAGTGTSFAAPIVSGGIALVAEAFPTLSPEEITTRILATANNSWFAAEGVAVTGTVDFGGGITHDYSNVWGHGVLDLAAALSPIGTVSIVTGGNVATASRTALDSAGVAVSSAFGDSLARGLADREMAVFDHFNGDFVVDPSALVVSRGAGSLARVTDLVRVAPGAFDPTVRAPSLAGGGVVEAAYGRDALAASSVLGLSRNAAFVTSGGDGWSTFAYAGGQQASDNLLAGFGFARTFDAFGGRFTIGASQNVEQGALLGLVGNDAFDFGRGTSITAGHLGYERAVGERFSVFANVEVGVANAFGVGSSSLVRSIGPVGFNGFNFGATAHGVIARNDRLTFSVSRPLRVASGAMELGVPVARLVDGTVTTEAVTLSLAPGGRQLDLGINYEVGIGAASTLRLAATYSLDAGNVDGARGLALAAGIGIGF
ncbi:MAG: S8 family serine peptidase [Bauldia sp.]|nr:S8 family serine peptidase [Bauldia sp.]